MAPHPSVPTTWYCPTGLIFDICCVQNSIPIFSEWEHHFLSEILPFRELKSHFLCVVLEVQIKILLWDCWKKIKKIKRPNNNNNKNPAMEPQIQPLLIIKSDTPWCACLGKDMHKGIPELASAIHPHVPESQETLCCLLHFPGSGSINMISAFMPLSKSVTAGPLDLKVCHAAALHSPTSQRPGHRNLWFKRGCYLDPGATGVFLG